MRAFLLLLILPSLLLSQSLEKKIKEAEFLIANGNLKEAIEIYSEILSVKKDIKIGKRLAELYLWTENVHGAISVYEKLLENGFENYEMLSELGQWYLWTGQQDKAISIYERLAEKFPDSLNVYRMLGKLYLWNEMNAKAVPVYEKIVQLAPNDTASILQLAQIYLWNNEQIKAIPLYRKLVRIFPDSTTYHWLLCQLLVWNNRTREAKIEIERFLKKNPKHKEALELYIQLLYYSGEWDNAKKFAHKLLEIDPQNQTTLKILGEINTNYTSKLRFEILRIHDTNKLTKTVFPFTSNIVFNRFLELNFNIERIEIEDGRINGKVFGYGGFALLKYNFSRGNSFAFGGGGFRYNERNFAVWQFNLNFNILDRIYPQVSYLRHENREGVRAIEDKISVDEFTLSTYWQIFQPLGVSVLGSYGIYSDGNVKRTFGSYFNLIAKRKNPTIIFVWFYAFEDFDSIYSNSIPYWTPNNLSTYWAEINVEQDVFTWLKFGVAGAIAKNPGVVTSLNYRGFARFNLGRFEIYALYEKYGSTVYNYKFFRTYASFRF